MSDLFKNASLPSLSNSSTLPSLSFNKKKNGNDGYYITRTPYSREAIEEEIAKAEEDAKYSNFPIPVKENGLQRFLKVFDVLNILRYPITNMIYTIAKESKTDGLGWDDFGKIVNSALMGAVLKEKHNTKDIIETLYPDAPSWVKNIGGFVGDVVTDPLTYLTFGTSAAAKTAVVKAGEVTRTALANGLVKDGLEVFGKKLMAFYGGKTTEEAMKIAVKTAEREAGKFGLRVGIPFTNKTALLKSATQSPGEVVGSWLGKIGEKVSPIAAKIPIVKNIEPTADIIRTGLKKTFDNDLQFGEIGKALGAPEKYKGVSSNLSLEMEKYSNELSNLYNQAVPIAKKLPANVGKSNAKAAEDTLEELRRLVEAQQPIPIELQPLLKSKNDITEKLGQMLIDRGMLTKEQLIPNYFPRYFINSKTGEQAVKRVQAFNPLYSNLKERMFETAEEAAKFGFKPLGAAESFNNYVIKSLKKMSSYDLVDVMVKNYGTDIAQSGFSAVQVAGFGEKYLPDDIAKQVNLINQIITEPSAAKPFIDGFNKVMNIWKKQVTVLNPGFAQRNLISNVWTYIYKDGVGPTPIQNLVNGLRISLNPNSTKTIKVVIDGKMVEKPIKDIYEIMRKSGVHTGGATSMEMASDAFESSLKNVTATGVKGKINKITGLPTAVNAANENTFRVASALNEMARGASIQSASKNVNKAFIDYNNLTKIEKTLRKWIPFYSWTKNNLVNQVEYILQNPGKYTMLSTKPLEAVNNLTDEEKKYLPDFMKEQGYTGVGRTATGNPQMLNPNLPFQIINQLTSSGTPLKAAGQTIWEGLNPALKLPFELINNVNTFQNKPIAADKYDTSPLPAMLEGIVSVMPQAIKDKLGIVNNEETGRIEAPAKWIYALLQAVPLVQNGEQIRALTNAKSPDYAKENSVSKLVSRGTGVKIMPYAVEYYKTKYLTNKLNDLLSYNKSKGL